MIRGSIALLLGSFVLGCSVQASDGIDPLASTSQAITGSCSINHLGAPCDPDGAGPLQECEGVCVLRPGTGFVPVTVACVTAASAGLPNMDGRLCGVSGTSVSNCNQVCQGKLCVAKTAVDGTACRPAGTNQTLCDGECKSGSCVAKGTKCPIERLAPGGFNQDCVWDFCAATNSSTCQKYAIPSGVQCSDGNACTTGDRCDGTGKCTGTPRVCPPSGDPCLNNACSPTSGACVATPTTNPCTLTGEKCFAGVCSGGTCTKGAPVDCDDKDACTVDSCDSATGCKHTPKACPPPSDACTVATCDKATGACGYAAKVCDDGNPCTTNACDKVAGCVFTPIPGCDAGPPDTGPIDTGVTDTAVVDSGIVIDTGVVDTSVPPEDTGAIDTGVPPEDTAVPPEDTDPSDTGDLDGAIDGATDGDVDSGLALDEDLSRGGCGCRTADASTSTSGLLAASLLGLAFVARRRR